jgi:hypothetical protein
MKSQAFPNCCTAKILSDFGGTNLSAGNQAPTSEDGMRAWVQQRMQYVSRGHVFVVITNSAQDVANRVLRELGFSHSKWMSKAQHSESKMRLWWKQAGIPYRSK